MRLVLIVVTFLALCWPQVSCLPSKSKLIKHFDRFNKILEKSAPKNNGFFSPNELLQLYKEEIKLFKANSVDQTYGLMNLIRVIHRLDLDGCKRSFDSFSVCDSALDRRKLKINHEIRPIDILTRSLAVQVVSICHNNMPIFEAQNYPVLFRKRQFDQIDEYLTRNVIDSSPETNMDALENWLATFKEQGALTDTIMSLIALRSFSEQVSCSQNEYRRLLDVELGAMDSRSDSRRINKMVRHYARQLAVKCRETNIRELKDKVHYLGETVNSLAIVTSAYFALMKEPLGLKLPVRSFEQLEQQLTNSKPLDDYVSGKLELPKTTPMQTFASIMLSQDDRFSSCLAKRSDSCGMEDVAKMVQSLLMAPCQRINKSLGDILNLIGHDNLILDGQRFSDDSPSLNLVMMANELCLFRISHHYTLWNDMIYWLEDPLHPTEVETFL